MTNRDGRLRVGFPTEMTKAKVEFKLRARPTFVFFVVPVGNPKPQAKTQVIEKWNIPMNNRNKKYSQKTKTSYSKKLQVIEKQKYSQKNKS